MRRSISLLTFGFFLALAPAKAQSWRQYASPEEAGFSSKTLDLARHFADSLKSGSVYVVYRGNVLAAWGDVSRPLQMHSMRKSLTSALYGIAVAGGSIKLDATLASLGVDDTTHLTDREKTAKVRDVISARSGVYLPAAYAPADQDSARPARGAFPPGTHWFYNNWDFNVAEWIYENRTGKSVFDAFAEQIAKPIGMEDFSVSDGFNAYEPHLSLIPAHTWRMSARDLARFGQLFLQRGKWSDKQIVPAAWVNESTSPKSEFGNNQGYGYMWWTYGKHAFSDRYKFLNTVESYTASGLGGHLMIIIPGEDLVIVHRSDSDHNRSVVASNRIAEGVLSAKVSSAKPNPKLVPVIAVPFESQLPPLPRPTILAIDATEVAAMVGEYDIGAPERATVTVFRGKPFVYMPGRGDAEMLRVAPGRYTLGVVPGVDIQIQRDAAGVVRTMSVNLGGRVINGTKRP